MVKVRRMKQSDVKQMMSWGKHEDVRLFHYNFDYTSQEDLSYWYRAKQQFLRRYIFGIYDSDELVGYITLKHINWLLRRGEMGIVMNPSKVSQGYGTEGIRQYLFLVFDKYFMKRINLKVAAFNKRAKHTYEKVGFKVYKEDFEVYEEQSYLLIDERYKAFPEMVYKNGRIYTKYYYMRYDKAND